MQFSLKKHTCFGANGQFEIKPAAIKKAVFSFLKYLVLFVIFGFMAIVLAISLRVFVFEIRVVPSASMTKAIFTGNYILVEKLSYGPLKPKKLSQIPWFGLLFLNNGNTYNGRFWNGRKPQANEVVVFTDSSNVFYVKRIIGMPGDTVCTANNRVLVNGKQHPEVPTVHYYITQTYSANQLVSKKINQNDTVFYVEKKTFNGVDKYFVMGDNRSFSHDSRFIGNIPDERIDGKVFMVISAKKITFL